MNTAQLKARRNFLICEMRRCFRSNDIADQCRAILFRKHVAELDAQILGLLK
jgi:hypothetical protein